MTESRLVTPLCQTLLSVTGKMRCILWRCLVPLGQRWRWTGNLFYIFTTEMLKEVKLGAMGKVSFYFKDSNRFFTMTVTEYAIPLMMQPEDNKKFKSYIKEFAENVNG